MAALGLATKSKNRNWKKQKKGTVTGQSQEKSTGATLKTSNI